MIKLENCKYDKKIRYYLKRVDRFKKYLYIIFRDEKYLINKM